jgi:hypothetical protein
VSLGGRIFLLNAVLNAIPIFYLSYLKIPVLVWKKIRRIQMEFLWGSRRGQKRINWIKWDVVCLPKKRGDLGVRDVRIINISLLAKWRWRLLFDDAVWKEVLKSKYSVSVVGKTNLGEEFKPWFASLWWSDICSIGTNLDNDWFRQGVVKKLGNDVNTSFWCDIWVGDVPLRDRFPRLFSISNQKEMSVSSVRRDLNGTTCWDLSWRRRFFVWEHDLLIDLLALINPISLSNDADSWGWLPEGAASFTVKSTFNVVSSLSALEVLAAPWHSFIFSSLWKCQAPSKVRGFVWQLLHGHIPTRRNLFIRRIIKDGGDCSCVLCGEDVESELHLFLYCEVAQLVWMDIFCWLQISFGLPHNPFPLFNCMLGVKNKNLRKGLSLIFCSVVWILWRCRNSVLFDNGRTSIPELVEAIKVSSWKWSLSDTSSPICLFYEWHAEPCLCILR